METFNPQENQKKYTRNGQDLIAEWAEISPRVAVIACITQLQKYCRRFGSDSAKSANPADLAKALDYLNRAKGILPTLWYFDQLQVGIFDRDFVSVDMFCKKILSYYG